MSLKNQSSIDALTQVTEQLTEALQSSGLTEVQVNIKTLVPWVKTLNEQTDSLQRDFWQHKMDAALLRQDIQEVKNQQITNKNVQTDLALLRQDIQEIKNQQLHNKNIHTVDSQGKWQVIIAIITASAALITSIITILIQTIK